MGTLIQSEGNGEKGTEESSAEKICASEPVVYQLVRVEGDGRLVPATDDELMEVEHLLEDDKSKLHSVEAKRHTKESPSKEGLSSKEPDLEGSEGLPDSWKLNARLEYIEVMLQKVKQEERLRLMCESVNRSPKYMVVDGRASDHPNHSHACDDKLRPGNTSMETASHPTCLNGSHGAQLGCVETCSEPANEAVSSRSSASETCTSSKPDFSILKGEVCLDNLTIRELQEVFRATFGRQTNVKDKLWLKRRIAMGLTNSCDVPTTSFVIKENKVVQEKVKEAPCRVQQNMLETGFLPTDKVTRSKNDNCGDSPNSPTNQIEDQQILSSKRLRKPIMEYDSMNENFQIELCAAKRIRKPTRRYIEELSEFETKEYTGRLISSVKNSGHGQSSPKSQIRPVRDVGSQVTTFVTRQDSLGGSGIQIPYVSRVRRGRPRKNFFALMNFASMERDKRDTETSNSEERDLGHEILDPAGDNSDSTADIMQTLKVGAKRKHHRAWTLCEVSKLVEGVARYGAGRWSEIRRLAFASYSYRTSVDLKDKWRNLLRASFAQEPSEKGAKNFRKHTSMPIPTPILLRVRELAEMHSQAGVELGPSKFAGHGGKIVQEKGSGFL